MWLHRTFQLPPATRGFHLITDLVERALPEIGQVQVGLLHVFIQHTSASLTINENADPDVARDLETSLNVVAPEEFPYTHTVEGPDDMPAQRQIDSDRLFSQRADSQWQALPRNLAGNLSLRTS